jgi:LEA14-like dessication related protein
MKTLSFLFLFCLITSCASFEDPVEVISYDGSKLDNINMEEAAIRVVGTVHNNTWLPIKIKPSTLEVYVDGKKWGDLYMDEKIRLKSNKNNELNTLVHVKFEDGLMAKLFIYRFKESAQLQLRGNVKTGLLFIPIKIPVNYTKTISPKNLNLNLDKQ